MTVIDLPQRGGPARTSFKVELYDSGNLAAASKVLLKAPGSCTSLLLTPDGGTVVCGTQYALVNGGVGTNGGCANGGRRAAAGARRADCRGRPASDWECD